MQKKTKLYSVEMTESELKLFSEFIQDRVYKQSQSQSSINEDHFRGPKDKERLKIKESGVNLYRDLEKDPSHRLSKKYIDEVNPKLLHESKKHYSPFFDDEAFYRGRDIEEMIEDEAGLKDSGYDDKYSSKLTERILNKKIDHHIAKDIVSGRVNLAEEYGYDFLNYPYEEGDKLKSKNPIETIRRRYNDSKLIRERISLTKDLNKIKDGKMTEEAFEEKYGYGPEYLMNRVF